MHMALYVINTTRSASRESKKCAGYLEMPASKWIESSFESEGALYWATMYVLLNPLTSWKTEKVLFLKRILVQAHARYCFTQRAAPSASASGGSANTGALLDRTPKEYQIYRTSLVFFGIIDNIYAIMLKGIDKRDNWTSEWPLALAEFIRNSDQLLLENGDQLLKTYQEDLLPSASFNEFCDVMGLLDEIPDPDAFLSATLELI